jgi:Mg-chelatase subunit ChlD
MSRLSLSAALEPSLSTTDSGLAAVVGVTYTPPDHAEPRPSSIVCVIDVSGSMQLPATVQSADGDGGDGELDDAGLDRLDLVKHAVSTVIATLQPQDQLGLVTYSDRSEVVLPLTPMDGGGVAAAREALKRMQPGGATNLWAGLSSGLELSAATATAASHAGAAGLGRSSHIILLTDGQPNEEPEEGHLHALDDFLKLRPAAAESVVSTFGFGYDLDSQLLHGIACRCGGTYTFVPDSSFIGTAFVNWLASALACTWQQTELVLEAVEGSALIEVVGTQGMAAILEDGAPRDDGTPATMRLGPSLSGQARSTVVTVQLPPGFADGGTVLRARVRGMAGGGAAPVELVGEATAAEEDGSAPEAVIPQLFRARLCQAIDRTMAAAATAPAGAPPTDAHVRELIATIRASGVQRLPQVGGLLRRSHIS